MIEIKTILCPTDLSAESSEALRYALALASAYKAKLIPLYCHEPGSIVDWATSSTAARRFQQLLFTHLDADELKALEWEAAIAEADNVSEAIIKEANKRRADLIVMRSRRRPHAAALLGSTAEMVSQNAPCPVLVTHPAEREWVGFSAGEIDIHRVLVATDFSTDAGLALNYGLSMAQGTEAELHLVHVVTHAEEEEPEVAWSHEGLRSLYKTAAHRLQQTVQAVPGSCHAVTAVRCGKPAGEILSYAKEHDIDLICLGASGAGLSIGTLLGTTVDRVLRRTPCPMLVAHPVKWALASAQAA